MFIQLCALLLLFCGVGNICCETVIVNSTDVLSLLDFKQAIIDTRGILSNWNESTSLCQWNGVQCNLKHPGRVTGLNLSGQGLSGSIAASVGNLTSLHILDLSSNNLLSGKIPHLNNLHNMRILNLSYNSLVGPIPDTLINCSKLTHIDFYGNSIEGEIPLRLDLLPNLFDLVLSRNNLTGTVPPTLGNITQLNRIALASNNLTGSIPQGIWKLPNLSALILSANKLSGEIPRILSNQSSLQRIFLTSNTLGGVLPPNIGDAFPNLRLLYLGGNTFQGHIPASLGNASELLKLDFSGNNFTGEIPSSFGKLPNISTLNFEINSLEARDSQSWEFFSALTNCTQLIVLSLYKNQLAGAIPDSVGNFTNLQHLLLGENMLSGTVPPNVGNLQSLIGLSLRTNNLSGTIENWIGKLTQLKILALQENSFTGLIPSSIGTLTQLSELHIGSNGFKGSIPSSLGNLKHLELLDLGNNKLQGNVTLGISKLVGLRRLNLSSNMLTGDIPDNWGNLSHIQTIEMDRNFLEGNIPKSFGSLQSLNMLNLSHNNLSGVIPRVLSGLKFSMIDLSYNNLQGQIPRDGIFENATAVSLDGNWGLCGGAMVFHFPSCSHASDKTKISYYLIRVLIPIFGFMSLLLAFYLLCIEKKILRKADLPLDNLIEHFPKVSYKDLAQATKNFSESNLVGRGSYGSVYRGKLKESEMEVAVKVFDLEMGGAERSFMLECEALRSIQHRNLLSILTACSTVDNTGNIFKALVYEFMPNGSLDTWLHCTKGEGKSPKCLGLKQRISIAVNIADALDYLHHDCGRPTVHCDLKPSNILLDDDMTALLADFGIARFYYSSMPTSSVTSISLKGTIGYIAPEYAHGGHVSTGGDVYSFGILLLEIMTGKRPTDPMFADGLDIIRFVERNFPHQISDVIDANILEECKDLSQSRMEAENMAHKCLISFLKLALPCTRPSPTERPNMKQIASGMHAIKKDVISFMRI